MAKRARRVTRKRPAAKESFDTFAYWLMPHGLRGLLTTVFWPASRSRRSRRRSTPARPRVPLLRPFPILAPGKAAREVGEHAFWRGSLWGRTVALQGDSSFTKYDLFEITGARMLYWGTFRGNGYYGSEESHSFSSPFGWLDEVMSVGDVKQMRVTDSVFDPRLRKLVNSGDSTLRVEIVAHHDTFRDPDSGIRYTDVLEMHYWSRYPASTSREVYHLGRGLGTIRFETFNRQEPSGVHYQFAELFERFTPPEQPSLPWLDPFANRTYVHNGFCEDFLRQPVEGGPVRELPARLVGIRRRRDHHRRRRRGHEPLEGRAPGNLRWGRRDRRLRHRLGLDPGHGREALSLERQPLAGLVGRQRLPGFQRRSGPGRGLPRRPGPVEAHRGVGAGVGRRTTVGPQTTAIKVRCVRDGANRGNAYCDGITLQRVD